MKKKVNLFWTFLFAAILLLGVTQAASAKFWGPEITSTSDWADGNCAYRTTCQTYYVFWIAVSNSCSTATIACL